jgi:hypothetical protein
VTGEINSYGGDAQIVATRCEIDRVITELNALENWLRSQVEFQDFADDPIRRVRLGLELPPILERISRVRDACMRAADAYFGAEAEISRELREGEKLPISKIASGFAGVGAVFGVLGETRVSANLVAMQNATSPPNSIGSLATRLSQTAELGGVSGTGISGSGIGGSGISGTRITGSGSPVPPGTDSGTAWLRVEKYREPASPVGSPDQTVAIGPARYIVYIPGTQSWGPKPGANPLDLTSNLSAISKTGYAGSERAVALAMNQAGIKPGDKVLLVGHSQGGMVAANLSTRFVGSSVLTFGAPLSSLNGNSSVQGLAVEHERDPVPKLDAQPNPIKANWVTVRQEIEGNNPISQHEMKGYLATAKAIDEVQPSGPNCAVNEQAKAQDLNLVKMREKISGFAGTEPGQTLYFELKRET